MALDITGACDIWSLGCTVHELLCGAPPYFDLNLYSAMIKIVELAPPAHPENISSELADFMTQCL